MNKSFVNALNQYFSRGVNTGALAMTLALVNSLENDLPEYIDDAEQLDQIFSEIEKDLREVWGEATAQKKGAEDIATLLIGHAEEIRKRHGLEPLAK